MVTITAETVAAAAERLLSEGKNPTQTAVRTALGGGSYSTIGPFLQQWRDSQEEAAELAEMDMPSALANAGSELMSRVWKVAMTEALAGHDALRKELVQSQADVDAAQRETADVAASLEADLAVRDERIAALEAQNAQYVADLKLMNDRAIIAERELAASRERADAETARADRSDKHSDEMAAAVKKLEAELSTLRERLDTTTASLADQKSEVARITSERDHAQKALSASDARLSKSEEKAEKLQMDLNHLQADLSTARSDLATARAERSQADEKSKALEAELLEIKKSSNASRDLTEGKKPVK